jgi:hypothetical protein
MPTFDQEMPFAESVRQFDKDGHGTVVVDNASVIAAEVGRWNDSQGFPGAAPANQSTDAFGCVLGLRGANPGDALGVAFAVAVLRRIRRKKRGVA